MIWFFWIMFRTDSAMSARMVMSMTVTISSSRVKPCVRFKFR
jgi:hypothetical protein